MIEVIDKSIIQQDLINEIKGAKVHTILCDEVTSSNDKIMSLCVWFVEPKNKSEKNSLSFFGVERITFLKQ